MNGTYWWTKMGGGFAACAFAALMAASLGGCKLLKPKEKKPFGADCATDLDCDSLTCSTTGNICSKSCTYDKDCGGDLVCRTKDDSAGNWCSKAVGTAPNGGCQSSWDCQHNHCLKYVGKEDQPGICSKYCQTADDCPDGMKICTKISDSGLLALCIPGDPKADASSRPQFSPTPVTPRGTPAPRPVVRPPPPPTHTAPPPPPPPTANPKDKDPHHKPATRPKH